MAEKPRVKAPKQRAASSSGDSSRTTMVAVIVAVVLALVLLGGVLFATLGGGDAGAADAEAVRTNMQAAGCKLQAVEALSGEHSVSDPGGSSDEWNTDPPTSGPHYAIAAVFGIYDDELEQARVVHNLEHGGIYIQYGKDVPESTVEQLRAFYNDHKAGTIMAPLDRLGDEFALGVWVAHGDPDMAYLATCKAFDDEAVSDFFRAFQFRGPEHFDPSDLQPGE
jgi:hypothetical protein